MSAVYDEVKRKALHRQALGFTTMYGEPAEPPVGTNQEYSSSSIGHYVGSAFIAGAVVIYALHGDPHEMGERAKILPVRSGQMFPLLGQTNTSTMSLGGAWVSSEPDVYGSGVVNLPWTRKVIYSGKVQIKTAQLPRRILKSIVQDFRSDEENG